MSDNDPMFNDLFGEANRANVSFYPIDPRGLAIFETPINQAAAARRGAVRRPRAGAANCCRRWRSTPTASRC